MRKKNGFTLIELLAVIVVLALIMIIVIPNVLNAVNSAKKESFFLYAQSLQSKAIAKYTQDLDLNRENTECAVYDISKDLNIGNTGKYKGWVKVSRVAANSGKLVAATKVEHNNLSYVYYCVAKSGETCNPSESYPVEEGSTSVTISKTVSKGYKMCYKYSYGEENSSGQKVMKTSEVKCVEGKNSGTNDTFDYQVNITLKDDNYKVENVLFNKDMPMETFYGEMKKGANLEINGPTCDGTAGGTYGTTSAVTTKEGVSSTTSRGTTIQDTTTTTTKDGYVESTTTTTSKNTVVQESTTTTTRQTYIMPTTTIAAENTSLLLNTLNVSGYDIGFNPLTFSYTLTVSNTVSNLSVTASSSDPNTNVTINGSDGLGVGSNIIRINLANENVNGESNYYIEVRRLDAAGNTVMVTRKGDAPIYNREEGLPDPTLEESDATLKSLQVSGYMLGYESGKTDYELTINEADSLAVSYQTTSSKARAYMEGNDGLKDGSKISIYVTSENGYYKKVYTITVHIKKKQTIMSTFLKFLIAGLGIILLALIVIINSNKRVSRRIRNKNDIIDVDKNESKDIVDSNKADNS